MQFPLPMFVLRWIVRRNPWLLAHNGAVRRSRTLSLGFFEIEIENEMELLPEQRAKLQAEADAGTLFDK